MPSTVTLASDDDVLVFTAEDVFTGPVFDRLTEWDELPEVDLDTEKRPEAIGDFVAERSYPAGARPAIKGQWHLRTVREARLARERLMGFYNDGRPITMIVADEVRTTSREVMVAAIDAPWTHLPHFAFTIDLHAEDARRYGPTVVSTTGLPKAGSGLDFGDNGLDFGTVGLDFGTVGEDGRLVVANPGNAETPVVFTVAGGAMIDGFEVVDVATGRRLTYVADVARGTAVSIDSDRELAYIDDVTPASRYLAGPEWWSVSRRSTAEVAFIARGATTGTPILSAAVAPAYY